MYLGCVTVVDCISVVNDKTPLPPVAATEEEDEALFNADAYIDGPIKVDYGTNLR